MELDVRLLSLQFLEDQRTRTVASFLQRFGRARRRAGTVRNDSGIATSWS